MQRAMARCEMPLWFTEGFDWHAYVSVAAFPLSTGYSGEWELLDFNLLTESVVPWKHLNSVFPEGFAIEIYPLSDGDPSCVKNTRGGSRITWSFARRFRGFRKAGIRAVCTWIAVEIVRV